PTPGPGLNDLPSRPQVPGITGRSGSEECLNVQADVDLVREDNLGAVGGQAEGDAEIAAADRSPGRKADPRFSLQPGRVGAEELDLEVDRPGDIPDRQLT